VAILPHAEDGIVFQITNMDDTVIIVKNPGWDNEEVILRFDEGWHPRRLPKYIDMITESEKFSSNFQKTYALVWLGYFYRSFQ
jgi:hypothetical protein